MITVTQVPNSHIAKIWPQVVPFLLKGAKYWEDFYGVEDFLKASMSGDMQLWLHIRDKQIKAVLFTSLLVYPKGKYLRYLYAGGSDLRVWQSYAYLIENWAKAQGAVGWEILGRQGWNKVAKRRLQTKGAIFFGSYSCGKFGD